MKKEERNPILGKQSVAFNEPVYLIDSASVAGKKEGEGPLGNLFDLTGGDDDDLFGCKSWEDAESCLQRQALSLALKKAGWKQEEVRFLFAGDLLGQEIATSFGLENFERPLFGLYGACSTCALSLTLASLIIAGGFAERAACVTSSHFGSAEKEFRFPLEYAGQRPLSTTWTVTGSGAFVLAAAGSSYAEGASVCITGITTGKVVDYGVKDSMHMGAAMAPAAADTIYRHLMDFGREAEEYDRIITGDLGSIGQTILKDLHRERAIELDGIHEDCGMLIYDPDSQDTHAGGSGCGCAAVVLAAYILPKLSRKEWKRVLLVPTGALLSKVSFNEGKSIPGIAHGVVLECI